MRVAALCGSLRAGSYNQALLDAAVERGLAFDVEIVQVQIRDFPLFNQDLEASPPEAVATAKGIVQSAEALLLVSPEHNYGVPGVLKNAVDWLSRPYRDPTLFGRPMAVITASTGYMGGMRAQLAWRQMWHFFGAPVFSGEEFTLAFAAKLVDADGRLTDDATLARLDTYLEALSQWVVRCRV